MFSLLYNLSQKRKNVFVAVSFVLKMKNIFVAV